MIGWEVRDGFLHPVVSCDACQRRIRDGRRANVIWDKKGTVRTCHKSCDPGASQWEDLDAAFGYLVVSCGLGDVVADATRHGWRTPEDFEQAA